MIADNKNHKLSDRTRQNKPGHRALRRGRVSIPNQVYLVTATTLKRQRFFQNFKVACIACKCFEARGSLGDTILLAWVLMPDHAHWLIQLGQQYALGDVINRLKSASARSVNRVMDRQGAFWQRGYHDHALRSQEDLRAVARYIIANPLRAGLVKRIGDYPFWNAVWV